MNVHREVRPSLLGLLCLAAMFAAGCGSEVRVSEVRVTVERESTVSHQAGTALLLESSNGSLEVLVDAGRSDVLIRMSAKVAGGSAAEAESRATATRIAATRDADGRLVIRPEMPAPRRTGDAASFVVMLPAVEGATLRATNGNISAIGVDGDVDARTSNGRVALSQIAGSVSAVSTNGSIRVVQAGGTIDVRTTNGNVSVDGATGRVDARTTNGSIEADAVGGPVSLATTNGSVRLSLLSTFAGSLDLGSSNGRIVLRRGAEEIANMRGGSGTFSIAPGPVSRVRTTNGSVTVTVASGE